MLAADEEFEVHEPATGRRFRMRATSAGGGTSDGVFRLGARRSYALLPEGEYCVIDDDGTFISTRHGYRLERTSAEAQGEPHAAVAAAALPLSAPPG